MLEAQAEKLWHCSNLYGIEPQQQLAERLVAHSFADTAFFGNSGAEALECAIKMARRFHTSGGQAERLPDHHLRGRLPRAHARDHLGRRPGEVPRRISPGLPGFDPVPLGDLDGRGCDRRETAAILIEPIQGEGGIRTPAPRFLEELRRLCDEHDLLLIFDEVQCGMGRTGRLFAYEWTGVAPDIMALAKGLGGGFRSARAWRPRAPPA